MNSKLIFKKFPEPYQGYDLPQKFNFPFYYEAHPLAIAASEALQSYLTTQKDFTHNFGLDPEQKGLVIGKMFGVLVVKNQQHELGYLWAFSGKLANSNAHKHFVPPVYDILDDDGFFRVGEQEINVVNEELEKLLESSLHAETKAIYNELLAKAETNISAYKEKMKQSKAARKQAKKQAIKTSGKLSNALINEHKEASLYQQFLLKEMIEYYDDELKPSRSQVTKQETKIQQLRQKRKELSAKLQLKIFTKYTFKNIAGTDKSLNQIFNEELSISPPAGAGECAAPKLLQYAFKNGLKPITMAEFWWGTPPPSRVRKHGSFYPACRSKCEPILAHMLSEMEVDENPMLHLDTEVDELDIIYEDDYIVAVNKPEEFLSVPGRNISDSIQTRLQAKYPEATGPLLVHRLDMSTSGIILAAKTMEIYKALQTQFIERTINKTYVALLEGIVDNHRGEINIPMRLDIDNRPFQLVDYNQGKIAKTAYKVLKTSDKHTLINFFPITGRTHQLRVHAAHKDGLHCPIVGDDLYGKRANRLYLHAEKLIFLHPITGKKISLFCPIDFEKQLG